MRKRADWGIVPDYEETTLILALIVAGRSGLMAFSNHSYHYDKHPDRGACRSARCVASNAAQLRAKQADYYAMAEMLCDLPAKDREAGLIITREH
jgi:hypothetical protein